MGYAALFNVWTTVKAPDPESGKLVSFLEIIRPGAFDAMFAEGQDVRCLFNHDENLILGRTAAGTLRLVVDEIGLAYECDPADVSYARDLVVSMTRKDVDQSSFTFTARPGGEVWSEQAGDGQWCRELFSVNVFDVAPVVFPAYGDTVAELRSSHCGAALRSLKAAIERRDATEAAMQARHRRIRLAKATR